MLPADNAVTAITQFEEFSGGSTGRKVLLGVEYLRQETAPSPELFVKFSRNFGDAVRDRGRTQMQFEIRFAALSASPGFPVAVPAPVFADYHAASATGILITERIPFGCNGIEPHYDKCLDYRLPDPVAHYEALLTAVATLAGAHKSGRLPAQLTTAFPVRVTAASVSEPPALDPARVEAQLVRFADFAASHPMLLPANIRTQSFLARLAAEIPRFIDDEPRVWASLRRHHDHIALCHWNANVDNAWFWRDTGGRLRCGLLDWGSVAQMNVAMVLWGALCSAETELWDHHLDHLIDMFAAQFRRSGGPQLRPELIRDHLMLYAAVMGITWLLDVPAYLCAQLPDPAHVAGRRDPAIRDNETVRARLQMFTNFANLWDTHDFGEILDRTLTAGSSPKPAGR